MSLLLVVYSHLVCLILDVCTLRRISMYMPGLRSEAPKLTKRRAEWSEALICPVLSYDTAVSAIYIESNDSRARYELQPCVPINKNMMCTLSIIDASIISV